MAAIRLSTSEIRRLSEEAVGTGYPLACVLRDHMGAEQWKCMHQIERREVVGCLLEALSDDTTTLNAPRKGVRARFDRLLKEMGELNANNSIALWTRYYWDSQIRKILDGEDYVPAAFEIDLTTYCDSGCFFCKEGRDKLKNEFPFQKLVADLTAFSRLQDKPLLVFSGGGEPTSYSGFAEAMRVAHSLGFEIYMSTHGGTIGTTGVPIEAFAGNCTVLKVSIGAASHRTYNKVHNRARELAAGEIRTVDYVLQQCARVASRRRSVMSLGKVVRLPRILLAMTVSPINQSEVLLMAQRAIDAGADAVLFRPIITSHKQLLEIEEGLRQMEEARLRYGNQIEVLTFNHRIDYGYQREDYFARCVAHPVVSPDGAADGSGTVTPCVYRRGNRIENAWLATTGAKTTPLPELIKSPMYGEVIAEQDRNLHVEGAKRCPRCRKVPNNVFLDILTQASPWEREIIRAAVLALYPRNPVGEIIRGLH